MIVTIHQPEHLPWPGFFSKVSRADTFVLLDTVKYKKNYFQNRNKICSKNGITWLTLPIQKCAHTTLIKDILINKNDKFYATWLQKIEESYDKFPYFNDIKTTLETIHGASGEHLADFNVKLIKFMLDYIGIKTKCVLASELCLGDSHDTTEGLLDICKTLQAKQYLSGPSGRDYLKIDRFKKSKINVSFHEYCPIGYPHPSTFFVPGISFIDAMMLYGPKSKGYLL